ncbi:sulfurtransferase TusD [Cellvibrio zantedeschiae]|uniref:Sulfurtransferase TusD n=1 Tax=Cellvibrio zantedeschiae TaxID=1237077 RepID=A0ABQ3B166_9GAMM|nr:sulfurtransferase complex subunit TusD [Cellvibrio zantedeschiae]GGY70506.1 sulfurtransferase TusD [Cellvibrio zantedeschiae]
MIFSIAIYAAPYSSQASDSAYRFALALLESGNSLYRVFFYHDAIHAASSLATPQQDESHYTQNWQQLAQKYNVDLVVCIAAALKRGLLNEQEAARYEKHAANLAEGFEISGLGQLVDAAVVSDRLITFGS